MLSANMFKKFQFKWTILIQMDFSNSNEAFQLKWDIPIEFQLKWTIPIEMDYSNLNGLF